MGCETATVEGFGWRGGTSKHLEAVCKWLNTGVLRERGLASRLPFTDRTQLRVWQVSMRWTPNKVTFLRVVVGFAAVCLFGRGAWANLTAVGLTVAAIPLGALDGPLAPKKKKATPRGRQMD